MKVFLRLTADVDARLRSMRRYHGELSRFIDQALISVNLLSVDLPPLQSVTPGLTAVLSEEADRRLREAKATRRRSMSVIASGALSKWLGDRNA